MQVSTACSDNWLSNGLIWLSYILWLQASKSPRGGKSGGWRVLLLELVPGIFKQAGCLSAVIC